MFSSSGVSLAVWIFSMVLLRSFSKRNIEARIDAGRGVRAWSSGDMYYDSCPCAYYK